MYKLMTRPKSVFLEVVEGLVFWPAHSYKRPGSEKPGTAIQRLSPETRKILQGLKSEDLADIRFQTWF